MFISPAYAQGVGAGGGDMLMSFLPLVLIFVVFWFFLIRPQQRKLKQHREMVSSLRRGDQVVTGGGILGRVTKLVDDNTVQVELAEGVRVRVVRGTITEVVARGEPVKGESRKSDDEGGAGTGSTGAAEKKPLFSFGSRK